VGGWSDTKVLNGPRPVTRREAEDEGDRLDFDRRTEILGVQKTFFSKSSATWIVLVY
jgi:hypothetical protein